MSNVVLSPEVLEEVLPHADLQELISAAYLHPGVAVSIPEEVVQGSYADVSAKALMEILEIRKHERSVSTQTLAFSFA